jgi:CheY-like chemotaxis protein
MFLEARGYSVTPVFNGDDALHLLNENPTGWDIVLLDEQMPGKDGLTTLKEIKALAHDLPVVMVTKSEEEHIMDDALGRKIDAYLTKPVNPSQILSVCKKILDSQYIVSTHSERQYIGAINDIRQMLSGEMSAADWIVLYNELIKWDFEIEAIDNETMRQSLAGQKSECNKAFADFIADNYISWTNNKNSAPILSPRVMEHFVAPLLKQKQKVYFIVCDCMRLDQYIGIETLLKNFFSIQRHCFYSILPTSTTFARTALFAGSYPIDIHKEYPGLWQSPDDDGAVNRYERRMLLENLKKNGVALPASPRLLRIQDAADARHACKTLQNNDDPFTALTVNFIDMLAHGRSTSALLQEIAPDETAFRSLTRSWFRYSALLELFKELALQKCTVVLTTDHGSMLCTRSTDIYGASSLPARRRYKFGTAINSDERHTLFIDEPAIFKLPAYSTNTRCIIGRENYYFVYPDKFENYQRHYRNSFFHGGISMEEMIVPLAIMQPK